MDELTKAIKKESKETISQLLSETVRGVINEAIGDEEDDDVEADYEIEDDADVEVDDSTEEVATDDATAEEATEDVDNKEWDGYENFKVGDDTYDFSGEEGDEHIVKVFKLLKNDDDIVVKQEGETLSLKDNETGAEYVIKTNCDDTCTCTPSTTQPVVDTQDDEEDEIEFEYDSEDDSDFDEDNEMEFELESDEEDNNDEEDETMKEGKEMVFEIDLGYTDNYQDKDPIKGLSNNEPSKSGKSWHKGVPTGTQKPWAGKGSSKPFGEKTVCCEGDDLNIDMPVDEMSDVDLTTEATNVTLPNRRKKSKSHSPQQKSNPKAAHHDSKNGDYKALEEACKKLQKENKELKAIIPQIKKAMNESVVVNYKLGRIVKLFSENTTTKKEKVDIINRFNEEAKTINETKALYESVKRELNNGVKKTPVFENNISTASKTSINETTVYQSNDVREMIDLMERINRR